MARYGAAYTALERELQVLLKPSSLRDRVEASRELEVRPGDSSLTPLEQARITLGDFNPQDKTHLAVYESFDTGKPLPISWDEALEIHIKVSNRTRPQPLAKSSIYKYNQAVKFFSPYSDPVHTTPDIVRQWISDHEEIYDPVTVAQRFRWLSAVYTSCIAEGKIQIQNPFDLVIYKASTPLERQRRPYTDDELRVIHKELPLVFQLCITGLRAGEFLTREKSDLVGQFLTIDAKPDFDWRPKNLSSIRRIPVPKTFKLKTYGKSYQGGIRDLGQDLRQFIKDPTAPLHSARHTFLSLARRADLNDSVTEALTGHRKKEGSRSAQMYGDFSDEVLMRGARKIWDYINNNIL